jgi:hypothetical protein
MTEVAARAMKVEAEAAEKVKNMGLKSQRGPRRGDRIIDGKSTRIAD